MDTKLSCLAALVVAVLVPSALADCKTTQGDPNFKFQNLCGKVFTVAANSLNVKSISCIPNWVDCDKNNASLATAHTTLVTDGEKSPKLTQKLTYLGNGILSRHYVEGDMWYTDIITSYSADGENIKMGLIICRDDEAKPVAKAVASNYKADFTNDVKILDKADPDEPMTWLKNTCNPNDYVEPYKRKRKFVFSV